MLILNYTDNKKAIHLSDFERETVVKKWIVSSRKASKRVNVSDEGIILLSCALLKEGFLKPEEIQFRYKNKVLVHNKLGQIKHYPEGFCDCANGYLIRILGW